ncbi:MAG TPA: 5'-3' exonuclease H3TH domain-containing protein, partial [Acidimicrobiales bacterium]
MSTLLLLDGNSLTYRAFFALPTDMSTASGQVTNAVFGFTSMLVNLLRDHRPTALAVAWDRPEPTFRHTEEPSYKAQREEAPDILRQQLGLVRQVCEALRIPMIEAPGYEADDIIATLATQARDRGDDVVIVTGDRDSYQLVEDPHVKVLYNRRGVSDYAFYDEAGIKERTGVTPAEYPQYAAMRGDPSDNLPGVPGVGEKTAAKLINTYGGLDGIFANLDQLTPKLRESLGASEDQVRRNLRLMILDREVPLEVGIDDLQRVPFDGDEVHKVFNFLEFRTLYERLVEAVADDHELPPAVSAGALECETSVVATAAEAVALLDGLVSESTDVMVPVAAAWESAPGRSPIAGLALAGVGGGAARVDDCVTAAWIPGDVLREPAVLDALRRLVAPGGRPVATHGAKALMRSLLALDVDVRTLDIDTEVACYLLDPADASYLPADLLLRYVGLTLAAGGGSVVQEGMLDLDGRGDDLPSETGRLAAAVGRIAPAVTEALTSQGLRDLYDRIERPLVRVLARMEHLGVAVDAAYLRELNDRLATEAAELEVAIQ